MRFVHYIQIDQLSNKLSPIKTNKRYSAHKEFTPVNKARKHINSSDQQNYSEVRNSSASSYYKFLAMVYFSKPNFV